MKTSLHFFSLKLAKATCFVLPLLLPHLSCTCGFESIISGSSVQQSSPSAMNAAMDCPSGVAIPNRLKWPILWMWLGSGGNEVYWQLARVLVLGRDFYLALWIVFTVNLLSKLYRFSCVSVEVAFNLHVLSIICVFHCCPPQDSAFYSFRCLVPLSIGDFTSQSRQSPPTHTNQQIRRRRNTTRLSPTRGFIPPCHKQCH